MRSKYKIIYILDFYFWHKWHNSKVWPFSKVWSLESKTNLNAIGLDIDAKSQQIAKLRCHITIRHLRVAVEENKDLPSNLSMFYSNFHRSSIAIAKLSL